MSLRFGKHIGFTCELKLMPASLFEATLMIEMSLLYGPNRHENAKKIVLELPFAGNNDRNMCIYLNDGIRDASQSIRFGIVSRKCLVHVNHDFQSPSASMAAVTPIVVIQNVLNQFPDIISNCGRRTLQLSTNFIKWNIRKFTSVQ